MTDDEIYDIVRKSYAKENADYIAKQIEIAKGRIMMKDNTIKFTDDDIVRIEEYMKLIEATSIQNAVMNAISIAMDERENNISP